MALQDQMSTSPLSREKEALLSLLYYAERRMSGLPRLVDLFNDRHLDRDFVEHLVGCMDLDQLVRELVADGWISLSAHNPEQARPSVLGWPRWGVGE
jgi:hypothetical protein